MADSDSVETLSADEAVRLADFARACKAATRVVALYPATHPAILASLCRVAETSERLRAHAVAQITVLPDGLVLDRRPAARPDSALGELATVLHGHLIGELRINGDLTPTAWHTFLTLLSRPVDDVRAEGGLERLWTSNGSGAIEVRQIDYRQVLLERNGDFASDWDHIVANYLQGEFSDLDDEAMSALLQIAQDLGRFKEFTEQLMTKAAESATRGKQEVVLRVLQALADYVARQHPEQLDQILNQIVNVLPRLTPELVITLITTGVPGREGEQGIDLPDEVRSRLSDHVVAEFVAHSISRDQNATERLVEAFQTLVPEREKHAELLAVAEQVVSNLPIARQPEFGNLWNSAVRMLTTYSDAKFVSDEYGKELATARAHAIEIEHLTDDPPDRIMAWLATIANDAVRDHEHQVVLDLLNIEIRPDAWHHVLESAVRSIEQYTLTGHLPLAQRVLDAIVGASADGQPFAQDARDGLGRLRNGPLMRHVVVYTRQAPDSDVQMISTFCRTLGPSVIGTLAEALTSEHGAAVKRLREVLLSFGAAGRPYADELRSSANPAARRIAIDLLRAFGGADALPDLVALLDDAEAAVQREALRAIVQIGTAEAYAMLQEALKKGNERTRDTMMQALVSSRDVRAAPLFVYILDHSDHRGALERVCISAMDALGKVGGDAESVEALTRVLHRGEWWAPLRTGRLRTAAASALRATGSEDAQRALHQAASNGSRTVRRIARAAIGTPLPSERRH
jgi:hypothetical protein